MDEDFAFDGDEANIAHIRRHGIAPDEVVQVFANGASDLRYEVVDGEDRWTSIGTHRRFADSSGDLDHAR